jgi:hypothetical protein
MKAVTKEKGKLKAHPRYWKIIEWSMRQAFTSAPLLAN